MQPTDLVALHRDIMSKGAGAFPTGGDNPPKPGKTATSGYEDRRFYKKSMRKNMRKP